MANLLSEAITTSYLGTEQEIPRGATSIEFWGVDADPATADVAVWVRLTDQSGTAVEVLIGAGASYQTDLDLGDAWTWNAKGETVSGLVQGVIV